jgi:hypothetical protein
VMRWRAKDITCPQPIGTDIKEYDIFGALG